MNQAEKKEKIRQHIVNVVFVIYWLLIFEGALRKWIFPGAQKILFFVRDPFVFYVYFLVLRHRMWPKVSGPFLFGKIVAIVFMLLALLQDMLVDVHPLVSAIGLRGYFWYVPLSFIIGEQFKGKDLARLVRQTLYVAVPIAGLVFMQFRTSPDSIWNRTLGDDSAYLVGGEFVRTYGTFTFSTGQVQFIGTIIPMCLACWLLPLSQRPLKQVALYICTAAVLINLYVAGARSAWFAGMLSMLAAFVSGVIMTNHKQRMQALLIPIVLSIVGGIFYVTVFNTAYQVMLDRQMTANANEGSTLMRALGIVTEVFSTLPHASFIGYGIGMGSNAAAILAQGSRATMAIAEGDLPRIIEEAGFPGLLYIALRVWLVVWLFFGALIATRRSNNPLPILLYSYTGVTLLLGQITLQGTINGYGWLFAGFCMAANRLGLKPKTKRIVQKRHLPSTAP